ncbi:Ldh family oxidoreductase [Nocardia xishanensis]
MEVAIAEVRAILRTIILQRSRLSRAEADLLADSYIEAELQGKASHGISAFVEMAELFHDARVTHSIIRESSSFAYVDGHGSFGAVLGPRLADIAIGKARAQGVGLVLVREIKSWLRPAAVARHVAERRMLGCVVNSGGTPMVAPPGGAEPVIGTNPIGLGVPTGDEPLLTDMATSVRAWGEIRMARERGHMLPGGAFIDSDGAPATDPDRVHAALPMSGHKGFGLGLFIELLCGALVDADGSAAAQQYYHRDRGAAILVIDPAATVGAEPFERDTARLIATIRSSAPAGHVSLPGDRSRVLRQAHLERGSVDLTEALWATIRSWAVPSAPHGAGADGEGVKP